MIPYKNLLVISLFLFGLTSSVYALELDMSVDEEIKRKADVLNSNSVYQEYLNCMDEFNDELSMSSKMIEDYVSEKV